MGPSSVCDPTCSTTHGQPGMNLTIRFVYLFDYSSGDRNPTKNFDFLFAKRRVEYGPTGIFGIIFPSNIFLTRWYPLDPANYFHC